MLGVTKGNKKHIPSPCCTVGEHETVNLSVVGSSPTLGANVAQLVLRAWCCGPGVADYRERLWEIGRRCPRTLAGFAEEQRLEGDRQEVSQDLAAAAGRRCPRTLPLALPLVGGVPGPCCWRCLCRWRWHW